MNLLGLSQQIPARTVYLTDGPSKTVEVGKQQIQLRNTTPKNMATATRTSVLFIQAFRYLGKYSVTDTHIDTLMRTLPDVDRERLWQDRVDASLISTPKALIMTTTTTMTMMVTMTTTGATSASSTSAATEVSPH